MSGDNNLISEADSLYEKCQKAKVYDLLISQKGSENVEIIWRLIRGAYNKSQDAEKEEKKRLIYEAYELAKRGLELDENNNEVQKWMGILLSKVGDYEGTKRKIELSKGMKVHFDKAIELKPDDPTPYHCLGMWYFSYADLAWYERKIAAVVFSSVPSCTYEEALKEFEKAENIRPSFYSMNQYMLGTVNLKMKNKAAAKEWFQKLLDYKVESSEDEEAIQKAKVQLKSL